MVDKPKPGYYFSHPKKNNEFYLLQVAKNGKFFQARDAKNQLILQNEGFLRSTVQKWIKPKSCVDFNYLLEEARISFLTAIDKYDLAHDISIRSYAKFHLMELRRQSFKQSRFIELKEQNCSEVYFLNNFDFKNFDLRNTVLDALQKVLSNLEQEVIYMFFFKGLKKRQIAIHRHCSEARICTVVKGALPKLKLYLLKIGIVPGFLELT